MYEPRFVNPASTQELQATFSGLSEAWKNGDGAAFADWCTEDVDFINLLGMHVKGRATVAELHDKIFRSLYKDSTVTFTIESVRTIAPNEVLAIAPSRVELPTKQHVSAVASVLLIRDGDRWKIANLHNTKREAT